MKNVLGFSTVCNNVKIDYLLSILEGSVDRSLLLDCFIKKRKEKNKGKSLKYAASSGGFHGMSGINCNRF